MPPKKTASKKSKTRKQNYVDVPELIKKMMDSLFKQLDEYLKASFMTGIHLIYKSPQRLRLSENSTISKSEELFRIYVTRNYNPKTRKQSIINLDSVSVHPLLKRKGILSTFIRMLIDKLKKETTYESLKFSNIMSDEMQQWMLNRKEDFGFEKITTSDVEIPSYIVHLLEKK